MLVNRDNLNALFTVYSALFNQGFNGAMPAWDKVSTKVPSVSGQNNYPWLGQFPGLRKWLGDRVVNRLKVHNWSIVNDEFEDTVAVPVSSIEDDQYATFSPLIQTLGDSARRHPDELVFSLFDTGAASLCYDGQNFFDTDHPVGTSTISNYTSGAGAAWYLLDASRPLKPFIYQERKPYKFVSLTADTDHNVFHRSEYLYGVEGRGAAGYGLWQLAYRSEATLNATNFKAARTAMKKIPRDDGKGYLNISPTILVCGPSNEDAAEEVIKSANLASGASNTLLNKVEILVVPYLT